MTDQKPNELQELLEKVKQDSCNRREYLIFLNALLAGVLTQPKQEPKQAK